MNKFHSVQISLFCKKNLAKILTVGSPGNGFQVLNRSVVACHVDNYSVYSFLSFNQCLRGHLEGLQLGQVLLNLSLDKDLFLADDLQESIKVRMGTEDDLLKAPVPGFQLIYGPGPVLKNLFINGPHLWTLSRRNMV